MSEYGPNYGAPMRRPDGGARHCVSCSEVVYDNEEILTLGYWDPEAKDQSGCRHARCLQVPVSRA